MAEQKGVQDWSDIIPFYFGDVSLDVSPDAGSCTRQYLVPWDYNRIQQVIQQFIGYPFTNYYSSGSGPVALGRHLPETVEFLIDDGGLGYMWALRASYKQFGGGGFLDGVADTNEQDYVIPYDAWLTSSGERNQFKQPYRAWSYALITVTYTTRAEEMYTLQEIANGYDSTGIPVGGGAVPFPENLSFAPEMGRYVDWQDDDSFTTISIPTGTWKRYVYGNTFSGMTDAGNQIAIPIPAGNLKLTWFDVLPEALNIQYSRMIQGRTNLDWFFGKAPGTLVYNGMKRRRRKSAFGQRTYNIEMNFSYRPQGVNFVINQQGTAYTALVAPPPPGIGYPNDPNGIIIPSGAPVPTAPVAPYPYNVPFGLPGPTPIKFALFFPLFLSPSLSNYLPSNSQSTSYTGCLQQTIANGY